MRPETILCENRLAAWRVRGNNAGGAHKIVHCAIPAGGPRRAYIRTASRGGRTRERVGEREYGRLNDSDSRGLEKERAWVGGKNEERCEE